MYEVESMTSMEAEDDVNNELHVDNAIFGVGGHISPCSADGVRQTPGTDNMNAKWIVDSKIQTFWDGSADGCDHPDISSPSSPADTWTEAEIAVVEEGWMCLGDNWERLAQFVGSKSSEEVERYIVSQKYLVEPVVIDIVPLNSSQVINDTQIPASTEEDVVASAQPIELAVSPVQSSAEMSSVSIGESQETQGERQECQDHDQELQASKKNTSSKIPVKSAGEGVVEVSKEQCSDSDEEIDIEGDIVEDISTDTVKPPVLEHHSRLSGDGGDCNQTQSEKDFRLPIPSQEVQLDPGTITFQEKFFLSEFFDGRTAKTPSRYLRIRNYILACWNENRPSYVSSTLMRMCLKKSGDVNSVGRIHQYLEQIGAINFGCSETQYYPVLSYNRPMTQIQGRVNKKRVSVRQPARRSAIQPRNRTQTHRVSLVEDVGCTTEHGEDGETIHTTIVHKQKSPTRSPSRSESVELVRCSRFDTMHPALFNVCLHLQALIVMDVHSHSCMTEVTGLLGGRFDNNSNTLHIMQTVPCRSSSSMSHCDMCPVSQAQAVERLSERGLGVVGWYHSHPTFLPNPSELDISTQENMQQWFSSALSNPVVGFIVSPYYPGNVTLASKFRCLTVETDKRTPYRYAVSVILNNLNMPSLKLQLGDIISLVQETPAAHKVGFYADFRPEITYLQKLLCSVKLHMDLCEDHVPAQVRNCVVGEVRRACLSMNTSDQEPECVIDLD